MYFVLCWFKGHTYPLTQKAAFVSKFGFQAIVNVEIMKENKEECAIVDEAWLVLGNVWHFPLNKGFLSWCQMTFKSCLKNDSCYKSFLKANNIAKTIQVIWKNQQCILAITEVPGFKMGFLSLFVVV